MSDQSILNPKAAPTATDQSRSTDVFRALQEIGLRARCRRRLYRDSIKILCRHFNSPYATISADLLSGAVNETADHGPSSRSQWHDDCLTAIIDAQYRDVAEAKLFESSTLKKKFAILSAPLHYDDDTIGAISVVTESRDKKDTEEKLKELLGLVHVLEALALLVSERHSQARQKVPDINSEATSKATEFRNEQELAFSITNGLKSSLRIDHVALSIVSGRRIRLLSISGFDDIRNRNPGVRLIQQAMEECLDTRGPVIYQSSKMLDGSGANLIHKEWHRQTGNSAVASIPLFRGRDCVAIVSLRNRTSRPFDKEDLQKVTLAVEPYLPGLDLLERANRGLIRTAADRWKQFAESNLAKHRPARILISAIVTALICWFLLASFPFRFTVPAKVAPRHVLHFAAPFGGTIVTSNVKQGDFVHAGQPLVEFDTVDLLTERKKLSAEVMIAKTKLNSALVGKDDQAASAANAEIVIAEAKIQLVDSQIERSVLRAPHDGVIISGNSADRIGEVVPLGAPLLTLGTADEFNIELEIPESCIRYVRQGQIGFFATNTRSDERLKFVVDRVPYTSTVRSDKIVYVADVSIKADAAALRVGMTGYAKITGQRKPIWWITTRKIIDAMRLRVWRL